MRIFILLEFISHLIALWICLVDLLTFFEIQQKLLANWVK
jgi:hypothetical protein